MNLGVLSGIIKHLPFSPVSLMDSEEWKRKKWHGQTMRKTDLFYYYYCCCYFSSLARGWAAHVFDCDCQNCWPTVSVWTEISKTEKCWLCKTFIPTSNPTPVTKSICNTLPVKWFDSLFLHSQALSKGREKEEHPAQCVCTCACVWIPTEGTGWSWRLTGAPWWAFQKNLHKHTPSELASNIKKRQAKTCWEICCYSFFLYLPKSND